MYKQGLIIAALFAAACTEETVDSTPTEAPAAAEVTESTGTADALAQLADASSDGSEEATASNLKLHLVEKYCIEYEHSGAMQSGTSKECLRKWGQEQSHWENTTVNMGGFSQSANQRSIMQGKSMVSFDPETMQGTKMDNPMFDTIAQAAQDQGTENFVDQMVAAMGFSATEQTKEIAGESCTVYAGQMGAMCMTSDGLTLETTIGPIVRRATSVDRTTGGTDEDYVIPDGITFTEMPDLGNFLQGGMPQPQ